MPQLKLSFDSKSPSKALTLSTSKSASTSSTISHKRNLSSSAPGAAAKTAVTDSIDNMAVKRTKVAPEDAGEEKGKAKGQPGNKRERSPEGNGVAGREAKKHKNAYEISEY